MMRTGAVPLERVVGKLLAEKNASLAVAESCTGGMLGQAITSVSGSSGYFLGGIIAYSNEAKIRQLGVTRSVLERHGAVSAETARQMAAGARRRFGADFGVSTTGIAGPKGGTRNKPVGLVFVGIAGPRACIATKFDFSGDRRRNRRSAVRAALKALREALTVKRRNI